MCPYQQLVTVLMWETVAALRAARGQLDISHKDHKDRPLSTFMLCYVTSPIANLDQMLDATGSYSNYCGRCTVHLEQGQLGTLLRGNGGCAGPNVG